MGGQGLVGPVGGEAGVEIGHVELLVEVAAQIGAIFYWELDPLRNRGFGLEVVDGAAVGVDLEYLVPLLAHRPPLEGREGAGGWGNIGHAVAVVRDS